MNSVAVNTLLGGSWEWSLWISIPKSTPAIHPWLRPAPFKVEWATVLVMYLASIMNIDGQLFGSGGSGQGQI